MTKRLFAYIGLSMLITFSVVFYLGVYGAVAALCASAVVLVFAFVKGNDSNKKVFALIAAVIILSTSYFYVFSSLKEQKNSAYDGKSATIISTLADSRKTRDYYFYELNCNKINNKEDSFKAILRSSADIGADYGDIVTCKVTLSKMDNSYYLSKGYDYYANSKGYFLDYTVQEVEDKGIGYIPVFIRDKLTYSISVLIPGYAGELCNAVTLGDKFGLSDKVYDDFSSTGLSYLIVISGLHMSLAAGFVFILTKKLKNTKKGRIIRSALITILIFLYMAVTGFAPSATRSGIMIIILYIGHAFNQKYDASNGLGFAAFVLTVLNPFAVGDVGMLLSFASTAGIIFLHPFFEKWYDLKFSERINNLYVLNEMAVNRIDKTRINFTLLMYDLLKAVYEMLATSVCAVIAITPLTLIFFGVCNPFVIIYSVFVSPFIGVLMLFSALSAVLWYIPVLSVLSYATALIAKLISVWIISFVGFIADIPFISFYSQPDYMKIWLAVTLVLFVSVLMFKQNRRNIIIASALSFAILLANICVGVVLSYDKTELRILKSGGGSTVVFKNDEGMSVLSSGGAYSSYDDVSQKLLTRSKKINMFVIQSPREKKDVAYAKDILGGFDVEKVLLYYRYNTNERVYRKARECGSYNEIKDNDSITVNLSSYVKDKVFNVNGHTWQYITDGNTSVLLAPYRGKADEIPEEFQNPDYLILNNDIDRIDSINCGEVIWTSDKSVPKKLGDVSLVNDNDYIIDFK